MKLFYTLNKDDYIKTIRITYIRILDNLFLIGMVVLLGATALMATAFIRFSLGNLLISFLFLSIAGYMYFVQPILVGRQVEKDKILQRQITWTVSDTDLTIKTNNEEMTSNWNVFSDLVETKEYYFFFYRERKRSFLIMPKRSFESLEQASDFLQRLKQMGMKPKPVIVQNWFVVLFAVFSLVTSILFVVITKNALP